MSILRPCANCGKAVARTIRGRCATCARTTGQRGYGGDHQRLRAELALTLPADCAYGCGVTLTSDSDWVAAHVIDGDPTSARVVSCRTCNERAKGLAQPTPSGLDRRAERQQLVRVI